MGADDIGELFPDADPALAGADSAKLLAKVLHMVRLEGWRVGNADITVVAQQPKLKGHKEKMRQTLAGLLGVHQGDVAVKAKTNEGMGFIGRGEGIAVMAVATLEK